VLRKGYSGILDYLPIIGQWAEVRSYSPGDQTAYTHRDLLLRYGITSKVDTSFYPIKWVLAVRKEDVEAANRVLSQLLTKELPEEMLPATLRKEAGTGQYILLGLLGLGVYYIFMRGK
jgi:hypothetical protein